MKTTLLFILLFSFQAFAKLSAQYVTISLKNGSIVTAMEEISKQTTYEFAYNKKLLANAKPITLNLKNETMESSLNLLFADQPFTFSIHDKIIIVEEKPAAPKNVHRSLSNQENQQKTARGRVVDSIGNPLVGASIRVLDPKGKRTSMQTKTDQYGEFILDNAPEEGSLEISFVGYLTRNLVVRANMGDIVLRTTHSGIDDVVIIGYGQTSRRLNTGSITSISAKDIEQQPVTNILSALSGRMAGVFVQTTNGLPGGNINVQIRGKGSLVAGTDPLYVIDGVPFEASDLYSVGHRFNNSSIVGVSSPLNSINPSDIESITVLKDADATAIYGSRGANGVVLITTKKGNIDDKSTIRLDVYRGVNRSSNLPRVMSIEQYLTVRREAFHNDGLTPSSDPYSTAYAPDLTLGWDTTQVTDWVDYVYGGTAHVTDLHSRISGGNKHTSFHLGGNYRTESNILPGDNHFGRGGIHGNLNHTAFDEKLSMTFSSSLILDQSTTSNPEATRYLLLNVPHYPIYDEAGAYNWINSNPEANMLANSQGKNRNILANLSVQYKILPSLQFKIHAGYNELNSNRINIFPSASLYPGTLNYTEVGNTATQSYIVEPQLNYQVKIGAGNLSSMIGGTYQYRFSDGMFVRAEDFATESLMRNIASAKTLKSPSSLESHYKYASLFGRLVYDYKSRYVISLTGRRDGSSKFGPGNQFGNFGSIGAAWIFSDEPWIQASQSILSFGKLRTSFGVTGNDKIANYQFLSTYKTGGSLVYSGVSPLQPSRIANADFRWENTRKFETALELGFLDDQLYFIVNYYRNQSSDQLVNYTLPSITGFSNYQANLPAVVRNTGWEIELQTKNIDRKDWSWSTNFNITFPKNKLVSFEDFEKSSYVNQYELGYDIDIIKGVRFLGVDPQTGTSIYADEKGNPSDTPYMSANLGKLSPDFYGGIGNSIQFKRWDFNLFLQFVKQMSQGGMIHTPGSGWGGMNWYTFMLDRWQNEGDITRVPKASTIWDSNYGNSNANLFNANYMRIKSVNLGYRLPIRSMDSKSVRIYAEGQNLFTFWKERKAMVDPESGGSSIPPVRSIVVGLSLTL